MKCPCWMKDVKVDRYHGTMSFRVAKWYVPVLYFKAVWQGFRHRRRLPLEVE